MKAPAPHRSQRPECTPAAPLVRSAEPPPPASQNRNRDARPRWISSPPPPDSWRSLRRATYPPLRRANSRLQTTQLQRHDARCR